MERRCDWFLCFATQTALAQRDGEMQRLKDDLESALTETKRLSECLQASENEMKAAAIVRPYFPS